MKEKKQKSSIQIVYELLSKSVRYIPTVYKPFRTNIRGKWEIVMTHDDNIQVVKIYRDDNNWSEYFLVDEGDYITTYPICERKRYMSGKTV